LSLGKLDEGKVGASFSDFELPETIQDTIDDMRGLVKEGQKIEYQHEGENWANSDKKLVKNIMINLISNAIKFSDPNGCIRIHSKQNGNTAIISVSDQGIGISEEDQKHLFSSFFRGHNAVNIQGTGLGLHIVKRYLDLIGGKISLKSKLGEGTTFTIEFPVLNHNNHEDDTSN